MGYERLLVLRCHPSKGITLVHTNRVYRKGRDRVRLEIQPAAPPHREHVRQAQGLVAHLMHSKLNFSSLCELRRNDHSWHVKAARRHDLG